MNATDLSFGVEIETIAPDSAVRDDGLRIGPYKRGIQVPYLPAGWNAEADGSIYNAGEIHSTSVRGTFASAVPRPRNCDLRCRHAA